VLPDDAGNRRALLVLALIFAVLAAGIIAVGIVFYKSQERSYKSGVERQLATIADLKVGEISLWRRERLGDAAAFYRNAPFAALVRRSLDRPADLRARNDLQAWISRVQADYNYDLFACSTRGAAYACPRRR
jgi:hypothetical protein